MKTKTLLIAAAALAAGIMSSQAQVYSQNVVGYVNIPLTNGAIQIVAPALDVDGTGTNNTISSVFSTNGATVGDSVFIFNGAGYNALNYSTVGRGASAVTGWYMNGVLTNGYPLNPGQAVFYLPAANETNTQVGVVLQSTNLSNPNLPQAGGIALISSMVPVSGGVTSQLQYNPTVGDSIFVFNGSGYNAYNYSTIGRGASAVTGWYLNGSLSEPQISAGSGFWLQPITSTNWVQNYSF